MALMKEIQGNQTGVQQLATSPTDEEIYAGSYELMVRAGTDYRPPFVELVTGLNERKAAQAVPERVTEEYKGNLYLEWMQYKFFYELGQTDLALTTLAASQICLKYEDFKQLLQEQDYIEAPKEGSVQNIYRFIDERLGVHDHFIKVINTTNAPQLREIINSCKNQNQLVPQEILEAKNILAEKLQNHLEAFKLLNEYLKKYAEFTADIARVRINYSIRENAQSDYVSLMSQFVQLNQMMANAMNERNFEMLNHIRSVAKVILSAELWDNTILYAESKGAKIEKKYDSSILNVMHHKFLESKQEGQFDSSLIKKLQKMVENSKDLLNQ